MQSPLHELERLAIEVERRRTGRNQWCPHAPHPKQAEFLALVDEEALYGGATAGGKSDALLMGALQNVHVPGYSAILFRRSYSDLALPGALMDRLGMWLTGTKARWNEQKRRWRFPAGSTIAFGYLDTARDRYRYQSAEFQYIGFDELTQFDEPDYLYLFSRLRRTVGLNVPLRMRAATNPGGRGHDWVKRRFIDGQARFVGARLADNPSADAESYRRQLAKLDPITRRQYEDGEWVQDSSGLVYHAFSEANLVDALPAPLTDTAWSLMLIIDFGFHDACAFTELGWLPDDPTLYAIGSFKQRGMTPHEVGDFVAKMPRRTRYHRIVGDTSGLGKGYSEEMRRHFKLPITPADKPNKQGYIDLLNGALSRHEVKLVRGACEPLTAELRSVVWNATRTKEQDGIDNHCTDTLLYGYRASYAFLNERKADTRPEEVKRTEAFARGRVEANRAHHDEAEKARAGRGQDDPDFWIG